MKDFFRNLRLYWWQYTLEALSVIMIALFVLIVVCALVPAMYGWSQNLGFALVIDVSLLILMLMLSE